MNISIKGFLNGLMVYWDGVQDASRYYVHLLIGDKHRKEVFENGRMVTKYGDETFQEIALVEVERNMKYYSFTNLAKIDQGEPGATGGYVSGRVSGVDTGKNYYIFVEAEDRSGEIIAKSEKELGQVYVLTNGYYSLEN